MCLAEASNLPGRLAGAAAVLKLPIQKLSGDPMRLLMVNDPALLRQCGRTERDVIPYAVRDTDLLEPILRRCRPLAASEIAEYHVSEHINDRGVMVDRQMCERAAAHHDAERDHVNETLAPPDRRRGALGSAHEAPGRVDLRRRCRRACSPSSSPRWTKSGRASGRPTSPWRATSCR